jgi:Tfp pilus assembly protein PilO
VKAAKLSRNAAIATIVAGDLLLLVIGWFLLISPQRSTAASIVRATSAAEVQLVEARKPVAPPQPAAAVQQPEIRTADVYSLSKAMPSTLDQPTLLLELDQVARSSGVTLSNISMSPPVLAGTFSKVQIPLTVTGDFYSLTDMLYRLRTLVSVRSGALETSGRLFSVDSVTLAPAGAGAELDATVSVTAYVYGSTLPGAVAAPAVVTPPAAGTGTDTTSTTTTDAPAADVAPGP